MGSIKGITIEIGGNTSKLQDSLKDVNKKSKDLQGELRQVDRLLKFDPKNTELLAQKQKLLTESVGNTSKKLDTLKEAQKQVKKQFEEGKIGESQYNAITREVIKTEQELGRLENRLGNVNSKWDDAGEKVGDMGSKATELGNKLVPVSAAAAGVAAGMIGMAVKVGQSADDINTLSKQTGIATDTIQKFQMATELIDIPLETMTGSLARLTKDMGDAQKRSKKIQEAFKTLKVDIEDENGALRDNEEVFYDVIEALGEVANETERDALAMDLFGKSAQDLNPLILGGADALKQLGKDAEEAGLILSQDALNSANEFNDEIDSLKATASATFMQIGMEILTVLLPVLKELVAGAKNVLKWFRSLDSSTLKWILAIASLVAAIAPALIIIGKLATGISAVITLVGTISTALTALGSVFAFLTGPIGLTIAAITALIAIIVYLWNTNEEFREFIIENWEKITNVVGQLVEGFTNGLTDNFGFMWEAIQLGFEAFSLLFEGDFSGFIEKITQAGLVWVSGWKDIGKNVVKGIWEGIKSMGNWIGGKVTGFLDDIVEGAKDALGIHSPSRVFADVIGKNMALGVGEGFSTNLSAVNSSISKDLDKTVSVANSKTFNSETNNVYKFYASVRSDSDTRSVARQIKRLERSAERGAGLD